MCRTFFTNHTLCGHLLVQTYACATYLEREEKKQKRSFLSKLFKPSLPAANCKQSDIQQTQFTVCRDCADARAWASESARQHLTARQKNELQRRLNRQLDARQEPTQPSSSTQRGVQQRSGRHHSPSRDESVRRDARAAAKRYNDIPRGVMEEFISLPGCDLDFFLQQSVTTRSNERPYPENRAQGLPPNPRPSTARPQPNHPGSSGLSRSNTSGIVKDFVSLSGSDVNFLAHHSGAPASDRRPHRQPRVQILPPQPGPPPNRPLPQLPTSAGLSRSNAAAIRGPSPQYPPPSSLDRPSTAPVAPQHNSQLWQASAAAGPSRNYSQAERHPRLWQSSHQSQRAPRIDTNVPQSQHVSGQEPISPVSPVSPLRSEEEPGAFEFPGSPSDTYPNPGPRYTRQVRLKGDTTPRIPLQQADQRAPQIISERAPQLPQLSHISSNLGRRIDDAEEYWLMPIEVPASSEDAEAEALEKYWYSY